MPFSFKTILIPVDFSINTEVAVKKAIEIADPEETSLYLLHVLNTQARQPAVSAGILESKVSNLTADEKLEQWKTTIVDFAPAIKVKTLVIRDASILETIIKTATDIKADLVVIGKKSNQSWFNFMQTVMPGEVAEQTGCAILTVKPGSMKTHNKTVVVPMSDEMQRQKMDAIAALCRKSRIKVHLLTFVNEKNEAGDPAISSLLEAYQWLKNSLHCSVEYSVLPNYNKARTMLDYAERIGADILLVYPRSETRIGWMNRHITDLLPANSRIQVLAVQPPH